jgi:hypothetical protein
MAVAHLIGDPIVDSILEVTRRTNTRGLPGNSPTYFLIFRRQMTLVRYPRSFLFAQREASAEGKTFTQGFSLKENFSDRQQADRSWGSGGPSGISLRNYFCIKILVRDVVPVG